MVIVRSVRSSPPVWQGADPGFSESLHDLFIFARTVLMVDSIHGWNERLTRRPARERNHTDPKCNRYPAG